MKKSKKHNTSNIHFPVEVLKDKIKDLFETVVSNATHHKNINEGLARRLKLFQSDAIIAESAFISEGVDEDLTYRHTIGIYANYLQFIWMLSYVAFTDYLTILQIFNNINPIQNLQALRTSQKVFDEAIRMLDASEVDGLMKAMPGRMYRLPNPVTQRDEWTDKIDTITIAAAAFILQHEYGHFELQHDDFTPKYELDADEHAIKHLIKWAKTQNDPEAMVNTIATGIGLELIASAYITPSLRQTTYPDTDNRIKINLELCEKYSGFILSTAVYEILREASKRWAKTQKIDITTIQHIVNGKDFLCALKDLLQPYKEKFA